MDDPLWIFVVGLNVEARCVLANALYGQEKVFKHFTTSKLVFKSLIRKKAFSGRRINIANTPNLDTPAWTHEKLRIRTFRDKLFVYVRDPSRCVNVNETEITEQLQSLKPKYMTTVSMYTSAPEHETDDKTIIGDWQFEKQKQWAIRLLKEIETHIKLGRRVTDIPLPKPEKVKTAESMEDALGAKQNEQHSLKEREAASSELVEEINEEQLALYKVTLEFGRSTSNHVRVNFVGNQSAGKTTLVKRLQMKDITCPDPEQKPTEALEIDQSTSRCLLEDGKRHWETASEGFLEELNHQRMAQAMKTVEAKIKNHFSSDEEEETEYSKSDDDIKKRYQQLLTKDVEGVPGNEEETLNLKKILRKKSSGVEQRYISYWDFGGQSVYYSSHQIFLSPSAVYVLVFDLSKDWKEKNPSTLNFRSHILSECTNEECLKYWVSSIRSFTHDAKGGCAPVLLVGTFLDKLKDKIRTARKGTSSGIVPESMIKNLVEKKIRELREILQLPAVQCVTIDNKNADRKELDILRNKILDLGLGLSNEDVPVAWIELERLMRLEKKSGKQRLSFDDLRRLNTSLDFPMKEHSRLEAFLGYQHQRGQLLHYQHKDLRELIILDPRIIAKFLNNLMRSEDISDQQSVMARTYDYNHNGIINDKYVESCAKVMKANYGLYINVDILLSLLKQLSIIHEFRSAESQPRYLLPCLLPLREKGRGSSTMSYMYKFKIAFPDNHLPPSFYHIFIAGLMNEWTLLEIEVGKPEIYNLYSCFRLHSDAQQIQVYWKQSCIYVDIFNFSTQNKISQEDVEEIIASIEKCISEIFLVYMHDNALYDLYIQCPKCPKGQDRFVSVLKLRKDGEAMCFGKREKDQHSIGVVAVLGKDAIKLTKDLKRKPTEVELGRLARYLKEDAKALAFGIKLFLANIVADNVIQETPKASLRRFQILMRWKCNNGSGTLRDLFELLTATKDYQVKELYSVVQTGKKSNLYELQSEQLDTAPCDMKVITTVSGCIGADYPFLFLELGLQYNDIEHVDHAHSKVTDRVLQLLIRWRQKYPNGSTTRLLLDTIKFIGTDTSEIVNMISKKIMMTDNSM